MSLSGCCVGGGIPLWLDLFHAGGLSSEADGVRLGVALAGLGAPDDLLDGDRWPFVGYLPELVFTNVAGVYIAGDDDGWRYAVQMCGPHWFAKAIDPNSNHHQGLGIYGSMSLAQLGCERHRREHRHKVGAQ